MGLHANIHQLNREVTISLCGEFRKGEFEQLRQILTHFQRRGCQTFVLDFRQAAPLSTAAKRSLQSLIGGAGFPRKRSIQNSAIRLLADTPAVRPQTGCGESVFLAAS